MTFRISLKTFEILEQRGLHCVYYAHSATRELHFRLIIDLKTKEGTVLFRTIVKEIDYLVKKYKGSLTGECDDGRLRGKFIPFMLGDEIYKLFQGVKQKLAEARCVQVIW